MNGTGVDRPTASRNLQELALITTDAAPGWVVSAEGYRRVRRALSKTPERYDVEAEPAMPFTPGEWRERKFVSLSTDVCIEAFPGSGSSYVSNSVRMAVDRPVNIESHFHFTVQLKRALGLGVPAVVLVRDPAGACASLRSKDPRLAEWVVLLRWIHYHRWVSRHLGSLDVFLFDEVIDDVDLLRRRSPTIASLVAGPIAPHQEFRQASRIRLPIDRSRVLNRRLLSAARSIYQRIEARTSNAEQVEEV
jgi:urease beta subunit